MHARQQRKRLGTKRIESGDKKNVPFMWGQKKIESGDKKNARPTLIYVLSQFLIFPFL
jgi:hypothetical protein